MNHGLQSTFTLNQIGRICQMPKAEVENRYRNREFGGFWDSLRGYHVVTRESLVEFMLKHKIALENLEY